MTEPYRVVAPKQCAATDGRDTSRVTVGKA